MPSTIRVLLVAAIAALLMFAPPEFRFSAGTTAIAQDPAPSVLTVFSGGAVEGKLARTQTTAQAFGASAFYSNVTSATLVRFVPSGDSDLFNVSFSAGCTKSLGGSLLIRVLDNGVSMQPADGTQVFCSSPSTATYTGTWVRRSSGAIFTGTNHTLQVQVRATAGVATL